MPATGSKKRTLDDYMKPQQVLAKFKAKADFIHYFGECRKHMPPCHFTLVVQLYVPPATMINKDFLKQVLANDKKLIKMSALRSINVPKFDEVSVKTIWPLIKQDPEVLVFFPDDYAKGRVPYRKYTFDILNTVRPEYVQKMIEHACTVRHAITEAGQHDDEILVSTEWQEQLRAIPFILSKSPPTLIFV